MDRDAARGQPALTSVGQVPMDRLRTIFDGMYDGVWLVAEDGRTTYANAAMAGLLGSTPGDMHDRRITDFLDEDLWTEVEDFLARQRTHAGERLELRMRRLDGGDLVGLVAGSPIKTSDGVYVGAMLNFSDITSRRRFDEQFAQTQRLEAIGQFAGGIAHDFNNLLTAILGYAELARASLPEGDPIRDDLAQVLAGGERASAITRKLLAFTRRQVLVPVDVDPGQILTDLVPILRPLMGDAVDIVLDIAPAHAWIRVDPTQLEQVIVNLAVNARDAMPDGGTVTFAVRDLESADVVALGDGVAPSGTAIVDPAVRISVADNGIGMDQATKAQIFDPFFTTFVTG
jgi:PAS domain S-box-containing protein